MDYDFIEKINSINVHSGIRPPKFKKKEHHYHNWYEIFIVRKGLCRFSVYDKFYDIKEGCLLPLEPGVFHYYTSSTGCEYTIIEITAGYIHRFFSAEAANMLLSGFKSVPVSLDTQTFNECVRNAVIADNDSNSTPADKLLAVGSVLNIISNARKDTPHAINDAKRSNTLEKLNHVTDYISGNFQTINSITELSKQCYISKSHLCRIFKQELGVSVSTYVNNLKINHARELLISTDMPIFDICFECGFNSTQYFHKVFKRNLGCSPKEYRLKNL